MKVGDGVRISIRNLKKRKGRTILTALGVAIGTAAIVSMVSLGIGLQKSATESLGDFGDLSILQVYPNYNNVEPGVNPRIREADITLLEQIPGVQAVMPVVGFYGPAEVQMGRQYNNPSVMGLDFSKAEAFGYKLAEGSLSAGDRREVVVSYNFPTSFFEKSRTRPDRGAGNEKDQYMGPDISYNPTRLPVVGRSVNLALEQYLGENEIKKKNYKLHITGVLAEGTGDWGSIIYVPISMVQEMNEWFGTGETSGGGRRPQETGYDNVRVKVISNEQVPDVVEGIRKAGLETWSPTDMLEELNQFFLIVQLILGGIGSVALLVATIGIINTMTMAILERNREIGVMKVIGATIPNIKLMFLTEAALIGILGGVWGLGSSYLIVRVVNAVAGNMMQQGMGLSGDLAVIPPWLALFALGFSVVIGLLAGLYPASKAARISPLEAIRNE